MIKRKIAINIGEERCSNKVRYETKEDALTSYKNYRLINRGKRGESKNRQKYDQRPYKCRYCQGWHMTKIRK